MIQALIDLAPWLLTNVVMLGVGVVIGKLVWRERRPPITGNWHAEPVIDRPAGSGQSRKPLPQVLDDAYEAEIEEGEIDTEVR